MNQTIRIPVQIQLGDYKHYTRDRMLSKPYYKLLVGLGIFADLFLLGVLILLFVSVGRAGHKAVDLIYFGCVFLAFTALVAGLIQMPGGLQYLSFRSTYRKSPLLRRPIVYQFGASGIQIHSAAGESAIQWERLVRVLELKSCFVLWDASGASLLIPRRCFKDSDQRKAFEERLRESVSSQILMLKGYGDGNFQPDLVEDTAVSDLEPNSDSAVLTFELALRASELMELTFHVYYTGFSGIFSTVIGVVMTAAGLQILHLRPSSGLMMLAMGLVFLVGMPGYLVLQINRAATQPGASVRYEYGIFADGYRVSGPAGSSYLRWADLWRIVETKDTIRFHQSPGMIHPIPKRVFEKRPEDLRTLRSVLSHLPNSRIKE